MLRSVLTVRSGVLFMSTAACTGPIACSFRSFARPSQNCAMLNTAFNTVGLLRGPFCHPCPMEVSSRSTPPRLRLWQVLQLISQLEESLGSNHSIFPNSTLAGFAGLLLSAGADLGI